MPAVNHSAKPYQNGFRNVLVSLFLVFLAACAQGETLTIAVASNFTSTLKSLAAEFEKECECEIRIVSASTGKLYAQIRNGANYDAFFAADMTTPTRLVKEGQALIDSYMVYAVGVLTLIGEIDLNKARKIAIANPKVAPYGKAAMDYIDTRNYSRLLSKKLVYAENVAQAFQFAQSGSADAAFVPLSMSSGPANKLAVKLVPRASYGPIRQAAVMLKEHAQMASFFEFVKSAKGREIITTSGFRVDAPGAGE